MDLEKYIEHTILKADATELELNKILDEALENNFLGVCVNPIYVKKAKDKLKDSAIKVVTVVGFPLGATLSESKAFEAKLSVENGADEIDMVINVGSIKNKDYDFCKKDISTVKKAIGNTPLKVIIETDLLTKDEIKKACELCVEGGADFIKTSTGFVKNGVGAKVEDVKIMSQYGLPVKASGGIKTKEQATNLILAGASRLGTSSGVQIVKGIL